MTIIGGLDLHRQQITFSCLDTETGEVREGQVRPATRRRLRSWLEESFGGYEDVEFALEGCTGWRFVAEELRRLRMGCHLAEPAETRALRGPKNRAKTDREDARHLCRLLCERRLPESWIPPHHVLEVRSLCRLYVSLQEERRAWMQRIHAQLYHQGVPPVAGLLTRAGLATLATAELSPAGRELVETALEQIKSLDAKIGPLKAKLQQIAASQPGVHALTAHYGIGPIVGVIVWCELGDCRRFRKADQAVRFAGLDITVWSSDSRRAPGHLSHQGSPQLRWALFEAAKRAGNEHAPEHAYYANVRERCGGKDAALSMARKLLRACYHTLRELGDAAWQPFEAVMAA